MIHRKPYAAGFTIVELLLVIVVIGVLTSIVVIGYNSVQNEARYARAISTLEQGQRKIAEWNLGKGARVPTSLSQVDASYFQDTALWSYYSYDASTNYCLSVTVDDQSFFHRGLDSQEPVEGSCDDPGLIDGVGAPLAYATQSTTPVSFDPISGTQDLTLYVAVQFNDAVADYGTLASLETASATNRLQLDTGATGNTSARYRIDTSAASNVTAQKSGVRTAGVHIGWVQVSNGMTTRSFNYDDPVALSTLALSPGTGFSFDQLSLRPTTASYEPLGAIVFPQAHDQTQRAHVIQWLSGMHGGNFSF